MLQSAISVPPVSTIQPHTFWLLDCTRFELLILGERSADSGPPVAPQKDRRFARVGALIPAIDDELGHGRQCRLGFAGRKRFELMHCIGDVARGNGYGIFNTIRFLQALH